MPSPPVSRIRSLLQEATRRRVYKVAVAYGAVSVGLIALADPVFPALRLPDVAITILVVSLAFGFPVAMVLAWAFDITPEGVVRTPADPQGASAGPRSPAPPAGGAAAGPTRRSWRWPGRKSARVTRREAPGASPLTSAPGLEETGAPPDPDRVRRATLAHLRHELRTPINAVIGYSEMLTEDAEEDGLGSEVADLGKIHKAGDELLSLVDQILDPERFAGGELRNEDMEEFGRQLRHQLRTPIDAVIGYSEILLENAQENDRLYMVPDLERIVTAGRQLIDRINEIVDFQGSLEAYRATSEKLSRSSRIAHEAVSRIRSLDSERTDSGDLHEGHLLVVDDNAMNRELLSRQLARAGYTVTTAAGGEEALELVRRQDFDLMLLDIMMPDVNGYDVLRRLKQDEELHVIPVIMISALDEIDSVVRCIEMGAEDYLPKPFDPVLLRARIDASMGIRLLRDRERLFEEELRRQEELVDHMLASVFPAPIAARFKAGEGDIVDAFPEATVLYAEFEGSARLTSRSDPGAFVARMNELFSIFDEIAGRHGIHTSQLTGNSYMAVGGVPEATPGHVGMVARMALDMMSVIAERNSGSRNRLAIRVGLHTGPLVAGIIGTEERVAYDVWGETVETAKRIAANGATDAVHVSAPVYGALKAGFTFENRGVIALDGKDHMRTYFLTGEAPAP